MSTSTRPILRYFGGKAEAAPWIVKHFPPHDIYVESFGGAGSVLFTKPPSRIEVYNDIYLEVLEFFRALREHPDSLIRSLQLTPWHRSEFEQAHEPAEHLVERARRFYVRSWQGFGGSGTLKDRRGRTGWRRSRTRPPQGSWADETALRSAVDRLRRVQLENRDAIDVIRAFDGPRTLHYVDPPYLLSARGARYPSEWYCHELSEIDHRRLLDVLLDVEGAVVLSGYRSDMYDQALAGWRRVDRRAVRMNGTSATESIWLSPAAGGQMTLFAARRDGCGAGAVTRETGVEA